MTRKTTFDIDPQGLCSTLKRRKRWLFSLFLELLQNALDADQVGRIEIVTEWLGKSGKVVITDDSPEGFRYLAHAYTMFARSTKADNVGKRGVFNIGEKMVIAACRGGARIETTKGGISFDPVKNTRTSIRKKREVGSRFEGTIPCLKDDWEEAISLLESVIVPDGITVVLNNCEIERREAKASVEIASLPTVRWDEATEQLKQTSRKATVEIYEPQGDEVPMVYELGLPVMKSGDKWHYNVLQRVPLNLERDSVPAAFLEKIRTAVLEELVSELEADEVADAWIQEAAANTDDEDTLNQVLDLQHGEDRVWFDPNDLEANMEAAAQGYAVLKGNQVQRGVRENIKRHSAMPPSGKLFPTPRITFSLDGEDVSYGEEKWTPDMHAIVDYAQQVGRKLLGFKPRVEIVNDKTSTYAGSWGQRTIQFNLAKLGKRWFKWSNLPAINRLIVHEFTHHFEKNHLSHNFAEMGIKLGVKLWKLGIDDAEFFAKPVEAAV